MLIPQFSLRWLFGLTAVMAVVFLIFSWARQGSVWAMGISAIILTLAVFMLVCAAQFAVVWLFSLVGDLWSARRSSSRREET